MNSSFFLIWIGRECGITSTRPEKIPTTTNRAIYHVVFSLSSFSIVHASAVLELEEECKQKASDNIHPTHLLIQVCLLLVSQVFAWVNYVECLHFDYTHFTSNDMEVFGVNEQNNRKKRRFFCRQENILPLQRILIYYAFFLRLFKCNEIYNRWNIGNDACIIEVEGIYGFEWCFLSSRAHSLIISSALEAYYFPVYCFAAFTDWFRFAFFHIAHSISKWKRNKPSETYSGQMQHICNIPA